jgi:transcriptional regulator with XRE-family HTH domain
VAKFGVGKTVETLGDYLREQRVAASLSLRQLAEQTGVSNPYLSQIERGMHAPSVRVLTSIAAALGLSPETLLAHAGMGDAADAHADSTEAAIRSDAALTDEQKDALLAVYRSYVAANSR